MKWNLIALILTSILICCSDGSTEIFTTATKQISIFEIYFKEAKSVDQLGIFLRDTLKLPVEWEPFDFFGNGVVYDAAYYFGNTTIELLALIPGDSTINVPARFNRVLFESKDIRQHDEYLTQQELQHTPPFEFYIFSDSSELQIGNQINLDSLSVSSNINVAFWQYESTGFNFSERTISGKNEEYLTNKLKDSFISNPLGILGLKEMQFTLSESAKEQWIKLLGEPEEQQWKLLNGPTMTYELAEHSLGLDRITLQVADLKIAIEYLNKNKIAFHDLNTRLELDRSRFYGLNIWIEE